jgi:3-hydroxyisobutyrate dehydrogenase-like beta-hydroxyacid dehydrogenase
MRTVTIGVIGLGAMGSRIARRLLDVGTHVVVWNRHAAKTAPLVDLGATTASTPADAARRADAVITMVRDSQALVEVTEARSGVAAGATGSTVVIQMSTVEQATVFRLASVLRGRAELLDAPVLGSVTEAEAGALVVFAGGRAKLVERWTPLLSTLGAVIPVGDLGAGTAAKLTANSTLFGVLGVLGEALALADGLRLSREVAYEVLAATPLAAQAERRRASIESDEYPVRFSLSLAVKDADLILEAAVGAGVDLRLVRAARGWLSDAEQAGAGAFDYSAVLARILRQRDA